jgi:3-oxoacyl-(acyl-carrier-protein) synthase
LSSSENRPGEASVFFVLESKQRATHRGAKFQQLLHDFFSAREGDEITAAFGDCGGATSALALALRLAG